jgi:hypothetical protein
VVVVVVDDVGGVDVVVVVVVVDVEAGDVVVVVDSGSSIVRTATTGPPPSSYTVVVAISEVGGCVDVVDVVDVVDGRVVATTVTGPIATGDVDVWVVVVGRGHVVTARSVVDGRVAAGVCAVADTSMADRSVLGGVAVPFGGSPSPAMPSADAESSGADPASVAAVSLTDVDPRDVVVEAQPDCAEATGC